MDIEVDSDVEEDDLESTDEEQEENMVGWNKCCNSTLEQLNYAFGFRTKSF